VGYNNMLCIHIVSVRTKCVQWNTYCAYGEVTQVAFSIHSVEVYNIIMPLSKVQSWLITATWRENKQVIELVIP